MTGEKSYKRVVQTFINKTDELVHIFVNGDEIITTPEHPFYVPVQGWMNAVQLRAGDILVQSNGDLLIVEKVQHELLESSIMVYNFEVEDFHTYFVGSMSVLVHNVCLGIGGKGYIGDTTWRSNVQTVKNGGTITELNGGIPTRLQGSLLIDEAGD